MKAPFDGPLVFKLGGVECIMKGFEMEFGEIWPTYSEDPAGVFPKHRRLTEATIKVYVKSDDETALLAWARGEKTDD